MPLPLWKAAPRAFLRFNLFSSVPRTAVSSALACVRNPLIGLPRRPTAFVCSISPDHARVWHFFARKAGLAEDWNVVFFDSAGTFDPARFPGARVVRFLNVYHGRKIDFFLRRSPSDIVFICDDDKYPVRGIGAETALLDNPGVAAVSLCPRSSFSFRIGGTDYRPMGSYAFLLKKRVILENGLRLQSPRRAVSACKEFPAGTKQQLGYDTADYANEKLLLAGWSLPFTEGAVTGFDGLSASFVLLSAYPKERMTGMLRAARHYSGGSVNGAVLRSLYCRTQFETVFRSVFKEPPLFSGGYSAGELRAIVRGNKHLSKLQKKDVLGYCDSMDRMREKLIDMAT